MPHCFTWFTLRRIHKAGLASLATAFVQASCVASHLFAPQRLHGARPASLACVRGAAGGQKPAADGRTLELVFRRPRPAAKPRGVDVLLIFNRLRPAIRPARRGAPGGASAVVSR